MKKFIVASLAATVAFVAAAQSQQPMSRMPQTGPPPDLVPPQTPPIYQAPPTQTTPPPQASAQAGQVYVYDQQPVQQQPAPTVANPALPLAQAQNPPAATVAPSYAPQLPYGAPQILQLAQAKVGDDTIIAYVRNSGYSYTLSADQIMYLKQQGVSDAVITTMLNQPKPAAVPYSTTTAPTQQPATTTTVAPSVTYVQPAPATSYYAYQPYYYPSYSYPAYSYPSYAWWPPISLSFGWGWGGGWRGGGGWHGGGGFHGGHR